MDRRRSVSRLALAGALIVLGIVLVVLVAVLEASTGIAVGAIALLAVGAVGLIFYGDRLAGDLASKPTRATRPARRRD